MSQVIQLPAQVLVGQTEELAYGRRTYLAEGHEQPLNHAAEQLVGLQIQRWLRQARVAAVQEIGTQQAQAANRPVDQIPDDRFGGRVPRQRVEVALDGAGGRFFLHGQDRQRKRGLEPVYQLCCPPAWLRKSARHEPDVSLIGPSAGATGSSGRRSWTRDTGRGSVDTFNPPSRDREPSRTGCFQLALFM